MSTKIYHYLDNTVKNYKKFQTFGDPKGIGFSPKKFN